MALGLLETGLQDERMELIVKWVKDTQILGMQGDYRVRNGDPAPGGWPFQYCVSCSGIFWFYCMWLMDSGPEKNNHYPDNDDTLVALQLLAMHRSEELASPEFRRGVEWLLGMQRADGGWACFDADNDHRFLNLFPFDQSEQFFDPTAPDITGRVLECFGIILSIADVYDDEDNNLTSDDGSITTTAETKACEEQGQKRRQRLDPELYKRMVQASHRALRFLETSQDIDSGTWWSRWHVNHLNGTTSVLCGLKYFLDDPNTDVAAMVKQMCERPLR